MRDRRSGSARCTLKVVLALRWLRHRLDVRTLAGEAGVSIATAYRYLHEALGRWRALDRVTVSPHRIGAIAAAALVLTSLDRGIR